MNVDSQISRLTAEVLEAMEQIKYLIANRTKLEALPGGAYCGHDPKKGVPRIDFDNLTHSQVVQVVRAFGGKWDKTVADSDKSRVDYQTREPVSGVTIRCWQGEPPPSCKIVEVEEEIPATVVPARKVKVKKMVCPGAEPVVLAVASAQASSNANGSGAVPVSVPPKEDDIPF